MQRHLPSKRPEKVWGSRKQLKPTTAWTYDWLWSNSGGIVTCRWDRSFSAGFIEESAQASCALLVLKEAESTKDGVWLKVKCLGCKDKDFQKTGKSEDAPVLWRNDQLPHGRRTWMPYRQVPLLSSWSQCEVDQQSGTKGYSGRRWSVRSLRQTNHLRAMAIPWWRKDRMHWWRIEQWAGIRVAFAGEELGKRHRNGGDGNQETYWSRGIGVGHKEKQAQLGGGGEGAATARGRAEANPRARKVLRTALSRLWRTDFRRIPAVEQLSHDGALEEEFMADTWEGRKSKMFQLALKPSLDPKSRVCREISLLSISSLSRLVHGRTSSRTDRYNVGSSTESTGNRDGHATRMGDGPLCGSIQARHSPVGNAIRDVWKRHEWKGSWQRGATFGSWFELSIEPRWKGKGRDPKSKGKKGKGRGKGKAAGEQRRSGDCPEA